MLEKMTTFNPLQRKGLRVRLWAGYMKGRRRTVFAGTKGGVYGEADTLWIALQRIFVLVEKNDDLQSVAAQGFGGSVMGVGYAWK
jgi:hypothetical protein